jgi:hypothetical protein
VWFIIYAAFGFSRPHSVSHMSGSWLWGIGKEKKATSSVRGGCYLLVVIALQRPTSQDMVVAASQHLMLVANSFLSRHIGVSLALGSIFISA